MNIVWFKKRLITIYSWKYIIFALIILVWCFAIWITSGILATRRIDLVVKRERQIAQSTADNIAANIYQRLSQVKNIPVVMAFDPSIASVLDSFFPDNKSSTLQINQKRDLFLADPELNAMTERLNEIRSKINLHTIFILNAAGDCIAAGKPPENPIFIGENYSDRLYFFSAQKGINGRQFAVGRTDRVNALFYSKPVLVSGRFIGAIVSRININNLTNLTLDQGVFVTDENGVVVLAEDRNILMKTLPGSTVLKLPEKDLKTVYRQDKLEILNILPWQLDGASDAVQWENSEYPFVYAHSVVNNEPVTVNVLRDLKEIVEIQHERVIWTVLVSGVGILSLLLVAGIALYIFSVSKHRQELLCLNERLNLEARTDALTGCANRRNFFELLESERQRGIRYSFPFSMLSLDIDHFKRINDLYGHPRGDQVLCHFVSIIGKNLRLTDRIGRVGGEEFNILLPQTVKSEANLIAERIREEVERSPALYEQMVISFTVSIGVAQWQLEKKETVNDFISRNDKALYEAKQRGRNQVVVDEGDTL
ncbi:diguanylate cyclase [Desulfovibrio aerotolerans]|uniref:diguanylate cyclase n=1 Tax=Solidesulfovibrio aerotolerans TaxID=295255 RepID=A0A7C9JBQ6_9BACT|nr:sensor domain-containing diguanylate cyclase [Solidesulfovibrio aerotolerans]MYL85378.1 diguanylate cyclase [Solidesulfovibrio aerotolerans]